jgi:hypothetical protein
MPAVVCEMGCADHIEDEFAWRFDACVDGTQRSDRSPDRQIHQEIAGLLGSKSSVPRLIDAGR